MGTERQTVSDEKCPKQDDPCCNFSWRRRSENEKEWQNAKDRPCIDAQPRIAGENLIPVLHNCLLKFLCSHHTKAHSQRENMRSFQTNTRIPVKKNCHCLSAEAMAVLLYCCTVRESPSKCLMAPNVTNRLFSSSYTLYFKDWKLVFKLTVVAFCSGGVETCAFSKL